MNEIKLDKTTLPDEEHLVRFQMKSDLQWHNGYFVWADQLFWVNSREFFTAWDVLFWEYVDEMLPTSA